ncbi:TetR family transcriptional regulator [Nocardia sp. ET3-3]|uniref:TetR family transcriptional regulator n=1 Tax=Nocardia terrae TaxID=2675851 RepID=A0A7K1US49_9NOCA|nr:TetR/AcrR family transcriptional regulator [Nocardia terrae]MVU77176.1 TetR family transcriptional regulator [Nocardia terrae]
MADIKHFDPDRALAQVERLFWENGAAATSIQDVSSSTGLNRSSLYATFGDKRELYRAALRRYLDRRALPAFEALAADGRGLPGVRDFFSALIDYRSSGKYAGWGCLVVNAHGGTERDDPEVSAALDEHHARLRDAFRRALAVAEDAGQLRPGTSLDASAEMLAMLAYGINVRSRAGASADVLHEVAAASIGLLAAPEAQL